MRRKTPRPRVYLGNLLGVTVTDAAGYAAIEPFPNDSTWYFDGTGQWRQLPPLTAATVSALGYWTVLTDGDIDEADLIFADGEAIAVFVPTP